MSDPWACEYCGHIYVVQSLARDCEARHDKETAP